jgi:putative transposase
LFGDRFRSWVIEDEEYLRAACRYAVNNPVRAGLCDHAWEWPWNASRYDLRSL